MSDVYERLAKSLDELPNGFPSTESGVELKILQKIFSPEEAELNIIMPIEPHTVEDLAAHFGKPAPEMQALLDTMLKKGQINFFKKFGQHFYMRVPFLIGIYEFQVGRMDEKLAELFEEYLPILSKTAGGHKPALLRVIPVNHQIQTELSVPRYDDLRKMIKASKSFNLIECICRKEQALVGNPCKHETETCLSFSDEEGAFNKSPIGRTISLDEALSVLDKAEKAGLVQSAMNIEEGPGTHVCLCCDCCCGVLRGLKNFKAPHMLARSNYVSIIDQDTCTECGICAEERCPMEAIVEEDDGFRVLPERCIGCGVCTTTCPSESISLISRSESEYEKPPVNMMEWYATRAVMRSAENTAK